MHRVNIVMCWILLLLAASRGSHLAAQGSCMPPHDLRVCQDAYGPKGRVFLVWSNGEADYTKVRLFLDDVLAGEGPGDARIGALADLTPGPHTFGVEGACGATATARTSMPFEVVTATPHDHPVESIQCMFDAAKGRLTASWVLSAKPSLFIDVYIRRAGFSSLFYVTTLAGDAKAVAIDGVVESDRVRLQFFDANCYGSALLGCPGPACMPPVQLRVCQDLYGNSSRVFVAWAPGAADYTAFEVLVDGVKVGETGPDRGLFYVDPIAPGPHTFGVRGICGAETTEPVTRTFDVLASSPHTEPAIHVHCQRDVAAKTITATWLPGARPSEFIDVYVRKPGVPLLDFVGTLGGDSNRVRVKEAGPEDEVVLQFFDFNCYGSPLVSCGEMPGSRRFLRGDVNGTATIDLSDAIAELRYLFLGDFEPICQDAADANDDAKLNVADPVFILNWLFSGGREPPAPGPKDCGVDPTPDPLAECLTGACE